MLSNPLNDEHLIPGSNRSSTSHGKALSGAGWLAVLMTGFGAGEARAQFTERTGADDRFLSRTAPYLPLGAGEEANYNLKWRRITARLRGSIQTEFADNLTLSEGTAQSDVFISPSLGAGIFWPVTRQNTLQFDLDFGYRYYLRYSKLISSVYVAPASHVEYRMVLGDIRVNLHDDFSIQVDPVARPEISGGNRKDPVIFRRFMNTAGISASWQPAERWTLVTGYDFSIDRSLSDDYASLDRNGHLFSAAIYRAVPPQWTLGFRASYSLTDYLLRIQHDGWGFNFGPLVAFQASENLLFDGGVDWSTSQFDSSGTIADHSDFSGMTFHAGARHMFNRRMHHNARVSKSVSLGLGSNYTDTFAVQYGITASLSRGVSVNSVIAYDHSLVSGVGGESSDRYLFYMGSGYAISRKWSLGLGYSFAMKDSDQAGRDYMQNRVTLDASYKF